MVAATLLHVLCLLALMAALLTVVASRGPEQRKHAKLGSPLADPKFSEARLDADDTEARWPGLLAKLRALDLPAAAANCNCGLELKQTF